MSNVFLVLSIISFLCIPIFIIFTLIRLLQKQTVKWCLQCAGISALLCIVCFIIFGFSLDDASTTKSESTTSQATELPTSASISQNTNTESKAKTIKSGTYNIAGVEFWFSDSVINDTTGKWRISSIASSTDITEYVIDYYYTLFGSDDEIHAIVNFSLNTTTYISVLYDGILDVEIHEYISGEEHDAKKLFGGTILSTYQINIETGEIEKIQ